MPETPAENVARSLISITLLFSKVSRQVLCVEAGKEFVDFLLAFLTLPVGCIVKLLGDASMLMRVHSSSDDDGPLQQSSSSTTNNSSTIMEAMEDNNIIKDHHHQKIIKDKTLQSCPDKVMTSMANVFDSVQSFENSRMCINKKFLLDPKPVGGHGASLLAAMTTAAAEDSSGNDGGKGRNLTSGYFRCSHACIFMTSKFGTTCPKHNRRMETRCKIVQEVTQGQVTTSADL
jgi:hypothetical protein